MSPPNLSGKSVSLQQIADDANQISELEAYIQPVIVVLGAALFREFGGLTTREVFQASESVDKYRTARVKNITTVSKSAKVCTGIGMGLTAIPSLVENGLKGRYGINSVERAATNVVTDMAIAAGISYVGGIGGAATVVIIGANPMWMVVTGATALWGSYKMYDGLTDLRDWICEQANFY